MISLVDWVSWYTLLVQVPDTPVARSAAKALLSWVVLYGAMAQLLRDVGMRYVNSTIDVLIQSIGVE